MLSSNYHPPREEKAQSKNQLWPEEEKKTRGIFSLRRVLWENHPTYSQAGIFHFPGYFGNKCLH